MNKKNLLTFLCFLLSFAAVAQQAESQLQLTSNITRKLIFEDTVFVLTLTVNNTGKSVANDVLVMNNLPQELTFDSFLEGKATQNAGSVLWFAEDIEAGGHKDLSIVVTINNKNQNIINHAFVWQYDGAHMYLNYNSAPNDSRTELVITDLNLIKFEENIVNDIEEVIELQEETEQQPIETVEIIEEDIENTIEVENTAEEIKSEEETEQQIVESEEITEEETEKAAEEKIETLKLEIQSLYEWIKNTINSQGTYLVQINSDKKAKVAEKNGTPAATKQNISWPTAIFQTEEESSIAELELKITIFNRFAVLVYEGSGGWDLTYNNKPADSGIYFYVVKFPDGEKLDNSFEIQY